MATTNLGTSLTIGGTGMLASATHWLAARSERTIVVARQASRFTRGDVRLVPVNADWTRPSFAPLIAEAIRKVGPIRQVLLWLHDPEALIPLLLPLIGTGRVVLVLGSSQSEPVTPPDIAPFTTVRLGSTKTASGRRWLTDNEISEGAIAALQDGHSRIVGDLVGLD
ncbi:hypothetical protein V1520DRAFT_13834 [Lipomyces starkeyi]|uniref:Pyrroline-5-carboxylate reductase catalytic N-terminal domain-containing protein n=1 Tax=Lipomyces starkeyi NRRL Y-11557 TaxID=675824 RepID=A0A1E3QE90_LIPST|nr:hypothetical protein LIPSTDRAFT_223454 [Lipomyces starkeyi NRRL Y-11557]